MKMQKKKKNGWGGVLFGVGGGRRIEVIVKMQEKKKSEGEELAWVDVNKELKIEVRIDFNEELKLW